MIINKRKSVQVTALAIAKRNYFTYLFSLLLLATIINMMIFSCTLAKGRNHVFKSEKAIAEQNSKAIANIDSHKYSRKYQSKSIKAIQVGIASYYGKKFNHRLTATGIVFDMNAITAASRTLPIPSVAKVTNLKNNKTLYVLVNDRGPYVKHRVMDLSKRAAEKLDYLKEGTTKVKIEYSPEKTYQLFKNSSEFQKYGITLAK